MGSAGVGKLVLGTRVHTAGGAALPDLAVLDHWCASVPAAVDTVAVAVDPVLYPLEQQRLSPLDPRVEVIQVSPWFGYSPALNVLLAFAARRGASHLLLQSVELELEAGDLARLCAHATADTLVVGARLSERHGGAPGTKALDGFTSPWNTLALWSIEKLCLTGFLSISDELLDEVPGGMEEVATISLLQHLRPEGARAKLVALDGIRWDTRWDDSLRTSWHETKMASKVERAELQLARLGVPRGTVDVLPPGEGAP